MPMCFVSGYEHGYDIFFHLTTFHSPLAWVFTGIKSKFVQVFNFAKFGVTGYLFTCLFVCNL